MQRPDGLWQLRDPRAASRIRMNIGTIVDTDKMAVRLQKSRGGKPLGRGGGGFASMLRKGDTFLIGGEIVRYEGMREMVVEVTRTPWQKPKIATFMGTKFATSTQLSDRILTMFRQDDWPELPEPHPRLAEASARSQPPARTRPAAGRKLPP
jgi:ATP-dependent Lhr-like helicase